MTTAASTASASASQAGDIAASASATVTFDPAAAYQQSRQIGLRPEPFGALAYHFVTRRLVFLKSNELVELVEALAGHRSADAAITAVIGNHQDHEADAGVSPKRRATYHRALASLLDSGVIEPRSSSEHQEPTEPDQHDEPSEPQEAHP